MPHVYSTATAHIKYVEYDKPESDRVLPRVIRSVEIKGGANLPTKTLETPAAVRTEVSNEDLAFLMNNDKFKEHVAKGFMRVEASNFLAETVANDMTPKDGCAPKTPEDFVTGEDAERDVRAIKVG